MRKYEDLTFTDDFMFCRLMQYDEEICKGVTELLIDKKIGGIVNRGGQHSVEITPDGHGVRLDVYLEDDENTIYNIEMQNAKYQDIARRSRYYQSMIDVDLSKRGTSYSELNNSYVIFITMFDPFGDGLAKYTFTNICHEKPERELDDGTTKIFVNATALCDIIEPKMRAFLKFLMNKEATDELTRRIERSVDQVKRDSLWKGDFMTLEEHYQIEREEGRQQGDAHRLAESVDALVEKLKMTIEEACDTLNATVKEYNEAKNR